MPHSSTVSFLRYCRGLQTRADKAPPRERFNPTHLKSLVPQMLMLTTTEPRMVDRNRANHSFRVAGDFIYRLHGAELKNTAFTSLFKPNHVDQVLTALVLARRREQALVLTISAPWLVQIQHNLADDTCLSQNETVHFEICLCPMTNPYGKVDRMVGIYQNLSALSKNPNGRLGRYTLVASRLYETEPQVDLPVHNARKPHLQLVASEGRRIA